MVAMLFMLQTWCDMDIFLNPINTPGWMIGALLVLYLVFPTCCRIITATSDIRTLWYTSGWFYFLTFIGAATKAGYVLGSPFNFLYQLSFKAHFAEFMFGITIGWIFIKTLETRKEKYVYLNKYGAVVGIGLLLSIFIFIDPYFYASVGVDNFMHVWSCNGLLSPLFAMIIWSLSSGEAVVFQSLLSSNILNYLGSISYGIYILQTMSFEIVKHLTDDITLYKLYFLPVLLINAVIAYHVFELPLAHVIIIGFKNTKRYLGLQLSVSATKHERINGQIEPTLDSFYLSSAVQYASDRMPVMFKLMLYYGGMTSMIVAYALTLIFALEGSSNLIRLDRNTSLGQLFEVGKWFVIIGVPATVCTLIGQYGWCPWNRGSHAICRSVIPPLDELLNRFQNRVFFRIVTRGTHPLLGKYFFFSLPSSYR